MRIDNIIASVLCAAAAVIGLLMCWMFFVWIPVNLWAEGKCLAKGYPKTNVTIGLQVYCMNLDGAVTTKVEKLK